jgi:ribosomal protein L11 methylase PrmA
MSKIQKHPSSYRDPSGFVFLHEGRYYRQVNQCFKDDYTLLKGSGLYDRLVKEKKLIPHIELDENFSQSDTWYCTLFPEQITFLSWPYEWCFSQLKDAALLTLDIVKEAMQHGMILKDATPFNIQFKNGRPVFIDTLSFEKYDATQPWIAYRQFTESFIVPLLLCVYRSPEMLKLLQVYPDGIPLPLAVKWLPWRSRFNFNISLHIFLQNRIAGKSNRASTVQPAFSQTKLLHIINNLTSFISGMQLRKAKTTWNNYYDETVLNEKYVNDKLSIVTKWLKDLPVTTLLDAGTNTGLFAEAVAKCAETVIAVDSDAGCIDRLYMQCKQTANTNILPLFIDICQPTPSTGWHNEERSSFVSRCSVDMILALAFIHHLVIGKNIPLPQVAETFSTLTEYMIIEFVPKEDEKVKQMLLHRKDIFPHYTEKAFEEIFHSFFEILQKVKIGNTERLLFLMRKKKQQ